MCCGGPPFGAPCAADFRAAGHPKNPRSASSHGLRARKPVPASERGDLEAESGQGVYAFLTLHRRVLITHGCAVVAGFWCEQTKLVQELMTDLIYVGMVVVFFVIGSLYVRLCEKL